MHSATDPERKPDRFYAIQSAFLYEFHRARFGVVHVVAFCGHSLLPPFPWRQIVSVIGASIFVLSIWRRVDTLKQWGSGLIGHVCGILMLQGVAYAVVDPFIKVTSLDAGQKHLSRPVLVALFSMTANGYDLFRARTLSAVVMFIFFITFAQALTDPA